jgi:hypothetical protein
MLIGSIDDTATEPALLAGVTRANLIGLMETNESTPHAKVIWQPPNHTIRAHYHEIDQYQVIVSGYGKFGSEQVKAGHFHYSDRATPYGPIVSGSTGLSYLTLRPQAEANVDVMAQWMPEARATRSRPPGRNLLRVLQDRAENSMWATLIDEVDGVNSRGLATSIELDISSPSSIASAGPAFLVVLDGMVKVTETVLKPPSTLWFDANDAWPTVHSGPRGASLLWLRFSEARMTDGLS